MSKYCETCLIQGHDEAECYVKNLELFKKKKESKEDEEVKGDIITDSKKETTTDKVDNQKQQTDKEDGFTEQKRKNIGRKQPPLQVWRVNTHNKFANLENKEGNTDQHDKGQGQQNK